MIKINKILSYDLVSDPGFREAKLEIIKTNLKRKLKIEKIFEIKNPLI